ncbi:hypothetical protein T261_5651 [Streptomyces lydicus]|nr:hypothetical protein T261_5651 [Streptomyces lydicus]
MGRGTEQPVPRGPPVRAGPAPDPYTRSVRPGPRRVPYLPRRGPARIPGTDEGLAAPCTERSPPH